MNRIIVTLAFFLFFAEVAFGGSIEGVVQFNGNVPPQKAFNPLKFKHICGEKIAKESLVVDNKGLVNVVLTLSGKKLKKSKRKAEKEYILNQEGCKYIPHVLAIPKESPVKILANDPTNHNIHTYSFDNDPINLMMTPGQDYEHEFEEPEVVKVECDLHNWMSAWIVVTENPFYSISGSGGKFEIKNIPPGMYKLTAWHETLGSMTQKIKIEDGPSRVKLDFSETPQVSRE
tara:strand:+ start:753 stop:1445 length:693 start_codon:yes stop_codon:yes gene_type:complete